MQTFLPYKSYEDTAKVLDYKRLGKQRVEVLQIFFSLTKENYGWKNHPIVKMWKGHERSLLTYGIIMCEEWISRGYNDTLLRRLDSYRFDFRTQRERKPLWTQDNYLVYSHRSNLIRKDPDYYGKIWPHIPDNIPYKWAI